MANEKRLIDANLMWTYAMNELQKANKRHENEPKFKAWSSGVAELIAALAMDMPTVDAVEVVHAQWLDGHAVDHNGKKVYDSIDCSHCNDIFKIESHDREYWKQRFKVCPFCGAIMDGGNEDV